MNLLPNFLPSIPPDRVPTHRVWPRDPERDMLETERFCSPMQSAIAGFDASDAIECGDTINRQDRASCECAQTGRRSRGHRPGRYRAGEDGAHRFDRRCVQTPFPELARWAVCAHTRAMQDIRIHHCGPGDYDAVVNIYNHYVEHTPVTFDTATFSVGERAPWFAQFTEDGPHQLLVAESDGAVVGFCCSTPFGTRPGYSVSVETTVYLAPDASGRGIGSALYAELFASLANCGLHGAYAGITLPNDASVALHRKFGFEEIGVETEVGFKFDQYWSVARFEKRI